ncbi:hypothetical protein EDD11_005295 [Mortierella claussenii]|nr:hypothetical protein EDD11_005295 [Mortierella claussenii]
MDRISRSDEYVSQSATRGAETSENATSSLSGSKTDRNASAQAGQQRDQLSWDQDNQNIQNNQSSDDWSNYQDRDQREQDRDRSSDQRQASSAQSEAVLQRSGRSGRENDLDRGDRSAEYADIDEAQDDYGQDQDQNQQNLYDNAEYN